MPIDHVPFRRCRLIFNPLGT